MEQTNSSQNICPCCSGLSFAECCEPYLAGKQAAPTPEKLMRSRYTAYSKAQMDYILQTMQGTPLNNFNFAEASKWAQQVNWQSLRVLHASQNQNKGIVEFIATYLLNDQIHHLHEISEFLFEAGRWYYISGKTPKIGRNDLCPCNSNKKYKNCCGSTV